MIKGEGLLHLILHRCQLFFFFLEQAVNRCLDVSTVSVTSRLQVRLKIKLYPGKAKRHAIQAGDSD